MPQTQGRKKTILAVDDAPENLDIIRAALVPEYTVTAVTSGAQAVKIAQSQEPDLILLDIRMSDVDGYDVCRILKRYQATRDIPIIFVTGMTLIEDEAYGLELGAVDYLAKPIKPSILQARVRTHLALADAIKRLAAQNKDLIESARLRDDIDSIIRHDLKSPLNIIIGIPQFLLMHSNLTSDQRDFIKLMEEAGYRMLDMVNRSLDIYKMENGVYNYNPSPVDLIKIMRGVLSELRTTISEKLLKITMTIDGIPIPIPISDSDTIIVMGEALLCHSMFSNLCKNAIEASPEIDVIMIDFQRGSDVTITIENGGEVSEQIRDRFFDKFVTAGKPNGTGIGTYSAMLTAKTQKGSIALDTSIKGRTQMRIVLPGGGE